jgi:phosphatidylinositol alpha-mannosyltransferase
VLDNGRVGALFPIGEPDRLAGTVIGLLGDEPRRRILREEALRVVRRYDWPAVSARVVAVYETVTAGAAPVGADPRGIAFGRWRR